MKKIFIAALALAAVAACNKAEVIETAPGEAIAFGDAFIDNATKADYSSTDTDITTFNVYGTVNNVNIYDATPVTKGTAEYGQAWTCGVTQYWIEGASYKFAALVDVPADNVNPDAYGMPSSFTYVADGKTDVLYNYVERTGAAKGSNDIVGFTFKHLLAKAYFTVTNGTNDSKYTYSISNIQLTNTRPSGTYSVYVSTAENAAGSWNSDVKTTSTDFASIENVAYGTPKTNAELLLIPGTEVGVSFTVTLYIDGNKVTEYPFTLEKATELNQNCIYNFNVTLSPNDPIQFTVTAKPNWGETVSVPVTIVE